MPKARIKFKGSAVIERLQGRFPNFLLGITVFVLVVLLGSLFLQNKELSGMQITQKLAEMFNFQKKEVVESDSARSYTVKAGDTLWSVAEEAYGSGYNAYDVAKANNIVNPNALNEGAVLKLPALEPKNPTQGELASGVFTTAQEQAAQQVQKAPASKTYIIQKGDSLWSISMRQYGNPYRWTEVWKSNPSIVNPDVIYAGATLSLP